MQKSTSVITVLSVAAFLAAFAINAASQGETCFYASKGFAADITFQTHGATCNKCNTKAGCSWIDKIQVCEQIREKQIPGAQPSTKVCSDADGLAYSEGEA